MNTFVEYAKLAEEYLEDSKVENVEFLSRDQKTLDLARAQVYAILAQAAATAELQRSIRITNSGVGW